MILINFAFIYLIQILLTFPTFYKTCERKTLYSYFLYFIHHLFDVFLFWSPFFLVTRKEFLLHIAIIVLIFIHWLTYDNKCIITVLMNRECGYPDEEWLDSLKNMLNLREVNEYFHFIWIGLLLAYDIYKIY